VQRLGAGRRIRTPLPTISDGLDPKVGGQPAQALGGGTRIRTPLPQPVPGELEEINLSRQPLQKRVSKKSRRAQLEAKAAQFRDIQDFLENPNLVDLRGEVLDTSSTPEEIETRKGEVRYQIQIMRSIVAVLTDELKELERAQPSASTDQATSTQS